MSFATLARGCATRGSNSLRSMRRLPAVSAGNTQPAIRATPRRFMGGGGGNQPISRSMEAELFQGHPKEPEGWETTIYLTYGATVVILTCALGFAPDTSIKTWASGEARARLALQAEGKLDKPVFGVHYDTPENKFDFECAKPDNPFNEEDDDDDDEDDDDEDEDEDDDE
mmetsp:Transcript_10183/g.22647  ORF Transcript_10183/g.22647 Transcript_10183/m.22647 type:complete len:170 (+) Transcript_10183:83-592(+)|eukprot:CAMPEP_0172305072 /NCGR_PEP_ID=MMETSP1058-20130122/6407_1 /TAXON_ID=83371 /ORGANISM="Detonula confervacea, Strain CCMP 353" /LENGTH=169 /DNA_ID=CAMNT_0013016535 /DNA_START=57 /DNA_END=566 /DNA_ORIENTATION=-